MEIDHASPEHPYRQLAALLREQIERGEITAHLPSLTALTAQTGLATGTVRRAIDILARDHLVQTVPGRGTFVTHWPAVAASCGSSQNPAERTSRRHTGDMTEFSMSRR